MSEKRIAELEHELAQAKRLKKIEDRKGSLGELVDAAMKAWGEQLSSCKEAKGSYKLYIFPPAGLENRYRGLLQSFHGFYFDQPWTYEQYRDSETSHWEPQRYFGNTIEELLPVNYKLLWLVGVTFFIEKVGHVSHRKEEHYERPLYQDLADPRRVKLDGIVVDLTNPEELDCAYNRAYASVRERVLGLTEQREKIEQLKESLKRLEDEMKKSSSKKLSSVTPFIK